MDLFCTNCGNQRTAAQRFCGACGSALGDVAAPEPAPVPPPSPQSSVAFGSPSVASSEHTIARSAVESFGGTRSEQSVSDAVSGGGSGALGQLVAALLPRPPAQRALIAASAVTVLTVLLAVSVDTYYSSGAARALPLLVVALFMWTALPAAVPGARADLRVVIAVTVAACVLVVVVHQTLDQWGIARVLVSAVSGFSYGAVASAAQLSARRRSPLTVVAMAGGPAVGAIGGLVVNIANFTSVGVWRLDLDVILSAAFVCALPVAAAVLGWSTPARSIDPSVPSNTAQGGEYALQPGGGSNGLAIASLVCGLIGVSIPAIVLGHIALSQIRSSGGRQGGRGMAIAGLVLGYLALVVVILVFVLLGVFAASLDPGGY